MAFTSKKIIKVMLVDDSAVVRQTISKVLDSDSEIEVIDACQDPYIAAKKLRCELPDVIVLDVEMPRMDGITFLQKIMSQNPIPVIICSTLVETGAETTLKALEYGAVDIIQKPTIGTKKFLEEATVLLTDAVKAAAKVNVKKISTRTRQVAPKLTADAVLSGVNGKAMSKTTEQIIVIGASTGGTEAVRSVLEVMPQDAPGIVIVQHMPQGFTASFAKRLNELCKINVKEAKDGDTVLRGHALIAPGNCHTLIKRSGARYFVEVRDGPLVARHRPSVDVLFRSSARYAGSNATAAILTGMGDDGAAGMKEMHDTGAYTIAQDEKTSVVYGMPASAVKQGGVDIILPLNRIAYELINGEISNSQCKAVTS
ncbi:Chemotaxis response regulator protein-glutamate methylesterase CheB [hydrothermal vent metagenome]|uniref:protein-glutamate methylesterase n=1 Tax=hydrothermal vent metagenome TaxID=652676 RepID=A0A3B0WL75_9ZZZZ